MSKAWDELKAEAGPYWAEAIARAAIKVIQTLKAQPGGGGTGEVHVRVSRKAVVGVRRGVLEDERTDGS